MNNRFSFFKYCNTLCVSILAVLLTACSGGGGGSSSTNSNVGFIQFYNASKNAPSVDLTVDNVTRTAVGYGSVSTFYQYSAGSHEVELTYIDGTQSETIYTQDINVIKGGVNFIVVSGDFANPTINIYNYNDVTLESDFSLQTINVHSSLENLSLYISASNETFNEAELVADVPNFSLSDETKYERGTYKFYVAEQNSTTPIFTSGTVSFAFTSQYIISLRDNVGPGESPITLSIIPQGNTLNNFTDINAQAEVRFYNALDNDVTIDVKVDGDLQFDALANGAFSDTIALPAKDYSMTATNDSDDSVLLDKNRLSLAVNTDKTVFFYIHKEFDEDRVLTDSYASSITLDNSNRVSLFDHLVTSVNLIQQYDNVDIYFVRSDEVIDSAVYRINNQGLGALTRLLPNNTYKLYVVAQQNLSELILIAGQELILNESSGDIFMVLEEDDSTSTGFKLTVASQSDSPDVL